MKTSVPLSSSISLGVPSRRPGLTLPLLFATVAMLLLLLSTASSTFADSATWKTNPGSGDWNTASNWTPPTIPNGPLDTAAFAFSNTTGVSVSGPNTTEVDGIVFNAGASAFTITVSPNVSLYFVGIGITNNSGITQNFVTTVNGAGRQGVINFTHSATAGSGTFFTNNGGTVSNNPGGIVEFYDTSTAGNGTFINNGSAVSDARGGATVFFSNAGNGTFINNGGTFSGAGGGETVFEVGSTAGNATLIANGGLDGGAGGRIGFVSSRGGTARVEVFGNGNLDTSFHNVRPGGVTIGSIEGDGLVFLGSNNVSVGSNNASTKFFGVIQDGGFLGGVGGSLTKVGTGKLVLRHRNTYTGGTTIKRGILVVNNIGGSGTGSGPVAVNGGRLGGVGTIAGAVTVGSGSGQGAVLSPGYQHSINPGTLTIQGSLTFNADATYEFELNSSSATADEVIANGVTINSGAQFSFEDIRSGTLPIGTVFTVINNIAAANPIIGTFSNLPDGGTFTSNGNTYQVNYHGGDGNDLTLTVVP